MLAQQTIPASRAACAIEQPALDDVVLADVECRPNDTAIAIIAEHPVIPVDPSPAGTVVTARRQRGRGSSWE